MNGRDAGAPGVSESFRKASNGDKSRNGRKPAPPFSLRLTATERAYLLQQAGGRPLGAYIRDRLLGERGQRRRICRRPAVDEKRIALVLAELGRSRLSSNLNQLAKAAHTGTLPVSAEVERDLRDACGAVLRMRDALISALGLKPETGA